MGRRGSRSWATGGERFNALDALSVEATSWRTEGRSVIAVAPGRWSAAGIESACGIDAVAWPQRPPTARTDAGDRRAGAVPELQIAPGSVVVLADAQCYGPAVIEHLLQSCDTAGASVVLLGPQWALESRPALANVAAYATELPARLPEDRSQPSLAVSGHRFGGVTVSAVPSLTAACEEAVRQLAAHREGPGDGTRRGAIVVTGDEAILTALRAMPGVDAGEVVHSRNLTRVLDAAAAGANAPGDTPHLVVLGGASLLRRGATAAPGTHRSHILVGPEMVAGSPAGLGRAAEAARPQYLTARLGAPPSGPGERLAWRQVAAAIEHYRDRWQITDDGHAFGRCSPAVEPRSQGEERAVVERLALEARAACRSRSEKGREDLGLSLGR